MMFNAATLRSGYMLKDTNEFAMQLEYMMRNTLGIDKDEAVDEEPELVDEIPEDDDDEDEEDEDDEDEDEEEEEEEEEEEGKDELQLQSDYWHYNTRIPCDLLQMATPIYNASGF